MTQSPLLALDAIDHTYTEDQLILKSISFGVEQGELLGILGPSGCGKTTLLRLIAGFERPSQGRIQLANRVVCGRRAWIPAEQRQVGMVFQDYALFPHLSVAKNIAFGLRQPAAATRQRVAEVLNLVDLAGLEDRYPHQLSGGQQQRVALARALAPAPKLILLDEPLSNLDVQVRVQLRYDLRDILKRAHTAGLLVTHDQEEALSICDRIVVMRQGYVEQIDTPEGIYKQPRSRF
ncbi:MAG: ABC transporter ATP-binding protein, partial [Cyanobacteria bacterium P01_A01_bin.135]